MFLTVERGGETLETSEARMQGTEETGKQGMTRDTLLSSFAMKRRKSYTSGHTIIVSFD